MTTSNSTTLSRTLVALALFVAAIGVGLFVAGATVGTTPAPQPQIHAPGEVGSGLDLPLQDGE